MRTGGKLRALFFLTVLLTLSFEVSANAASSVYPQIYVSLSDTDEGEPAQVVRLWEYGTNTTFFLPAYADPANLTLYFTVRNGVKIDGEACVSGQKLSLEIGSTYTIRYGGTNRKLRVMRAENLPAMFVNTASGDLKFIHAVNGNKETGSVRVMSTAGETLVQSALEHVRGRGDSSFSQPKRPYQIKFEKKTALFNMNAAKKWVLLANHKDTSFLRNNVMFEAARALGAPYASNDQAVDLYMNGCYVGVYQLCEKVEIAGGRIDANDLEEATERLNDQPLDSYPRFGSNKAKAGTQKGYEIPNDPEDITGGYLLELEKPYHYHEKASGFVTGRGQPIVIRSPEAVSRKQVAYISDYIQHFEDALFAKDGIDPQTGKYYTDFIDLDSMVYEYLLEEVFKNYDVNKSSQYIIKYADSENRPAVFGPPWDFDLSMGGWTDETNKSIVYPTRLLAAVSGSSSYWLPRLYAHKDFYERAITLYYERFVPYLNALLNTQGASDPKIVPLLARGEALSASAAMNFTRWPILNSTIGCADTGKTYQDKVNYLAAWLERRMAFLDSEWLADYQALFAK